MTSITKFSKSLDAKIEINTFKGSGDFHIVAAACGNFSALDKLGWPVSQMQLRGFGKSVVTKDQAALFELHSYMADIDSVIDLHASPDNKSQKTVLFGYSHGGYFTTMHALGNPNNVSALILVEPALFTLREDLLDRAKMASEGKGIASIERMLRAVEPKIGLRVQAVNEVAKTIFDNVNDERALANEFRIRAENPITDENLSSLKMPVLLIGGTESHVRSTINRAFHSIPNASVSWVRGATHLDLQDDKYADHISSAVVQFLNHIV
jgi:pimeloyl-ACP methyl ester carboxylesterase